MNDKTRGEITESISDAVSDAIATQILNHNSKLDIDDTFRFARYDVVVNDDSMI